jgi:hypothetical protein
MLQPGEWMLGLDPRLSIGMVNGPTEYEFTQIQSAGRLPNGGYFVAQLSNPPQIRLFDLEGTHVLSIGRAGEGPGELTGIAWADLRGDRIRVYDFWSARITYFDLRGDVVREIPLRTLAGMPVNRVSASPGFAAGDLLGRSNAMVQSDAPKGLARSATFLLRIAETGELVDSFPPQPNVDYLGTLERNIVLPLGRRTAALAHDSLLYVATGDAFEVHVYGPGGDLDAIYRREGDRRSVTPEHADALREQQLASARDENARRRVEQGFQDVPMPELLPSYSRQLLVDDEENLWIEQYVAPADTLRLWDVFATSGEYVASLAVPKAFELKTVAGSEAIGIWTGDYDVESVRVYGFKK